MTALPVEYFFSNFSPFLFASYLNDLVSPLLITITIGDITVIVLYYASDIVLLSNFSSNLQTIIDSLHGYSDLWHSKLNLTKSKVLVFRNGTGIPKDIKWMYVANEIEIVNSYKYLGINLCYNLSFSKHLQIN